MGVSVARLSDARLSMMRLTHSICTAVSGLSCAEKGHAERSCVDRRCQAPRCMCRWSLATAATPAAATHLKGEGAAHRCHNCHSVDSELKLQLEGGQKTSVGWAQQELMRSPKTTHTCSATSREARGCVTAWCTCRKRAIPAYTLRPHFTALTMEAKLLSINRMSDASFAMDVPALRCMVASQSARSAVPRPAGGISTGLQAHASIDMYQRTIVHGKANISQAQRRRVVGAISSDSHHLVWVILQP